MRSDVSSDEMPVDNALTDDTTCDDVSVPPAEAALQRGRGRRADGPTEMTFAAWRDIGARVRAEAKDDHVALLAAGVAFFSLLAAVPGLVAVISIYGLVAEPADIGPQIVDALAAAPREVRDLATAQMEAIAGTSGASTLLAAVFGILVALWSASAGIGHLIEALNVAYDEKDRRGWVRRKLRALGFTVGAIVFIVLAFGAITVLPAIVADSALGGAGKFMIEAVRWVVLFALMIGGLAVLYRYGPDRDEPRWRWTSPGAIMAALLWVAGSMLFSLYTTNLGKYNETYGSLGAIVVVMLWLFLTSAVVIIGAEVNAELERQTLKDTTEGPSQPIGFRDAEVADTVGKTAEQMKSSRRESDNPTRQGPDTPGFSAQRTGNRMSMTNDQDSPEPSETPTDDLPDEMKDADTANGEGEPNVDVETGAPQDRGTADRDRRPDLGLHQR